MYQWRTLSESERAAIVESRKQQRRPWHSPPHWTQNTPVRFHLTAACYEHAPVIGFAPARMDSFSERLLAACEGAKLTAWCLLPNHYHLLVEVDNVQTFIRALGQLHGRSSREWNLEENAVGRKIFHRIADRHIRSERHFWATLNYIHHNPVRHGYVQRWSEWPWSSAAEYMKTVGRDEATRIWKAYPLLDYGDGWDAPET